MTPKGAALFIAVTSLAVIVAIAIVLALWQNDPPRQWSEPQITTTVP